MYTKLMKLNKIVPLFKQIENKKDSNIVHKLLVEYKS